MKPILFLLSTCLLTIPSLVVAQQQYYDWHITAGIGSMAYYGDLSHKLSSAKINLPAYQFSIGRNLSPSLALTIGAVYGQISANDRATDWNGKLRTDSKNFSRALNFQTDIRQINLLLKYRLNNGNVLSKHSLFSPYLYGGVGITNFTVHGDLFDTNGQRYYYWSDNSIRNQAESPATINSAQLISQDRKFETNLSDLATEQAYPTTILTIPAGVGFALRLSDKVSVNLETGVNYAFSGYLDDVKGTYKNEYDNPLQAYAANPSGIIRDFRGNNSNNQNDIYFSAFLSIGYHFNFKKKRFNPPIVYTGYKESSQPIAYDNDAEKLEENQSIIEENALTVKPVPEITSLPKAVNTLPKAELKDNSQLENNRQTVDINLRVFVEQGKVIVDTMQVSQTSTHPDAISKAYNSSQITSLYDSVYSKQADTLAFTRNNPRGSTLDYSLSNELTQIRAELDSLKSVQQTMINNQQNAPGQARLQNNTGFATSQFRSQVSKQQREDAQLVALQQEVVNLSAELATQKRINNTLRSQPSQVIIKEPTTTNQRLNPGVTLGLPLLSGNNYDQNNMEALRKEVTTIQQQLATLNSQQKIEKDTLLDNKLDSLTSLMNRIDSLNTLNSRNKSSNITAPVKADSLVNIQLVNSLQAQIKGLNESLSAMQTKYSAGMDSLSANVPLSVLGNTVIYYDINDATLKSEDIQRLSILGNKIKVNSSVLLHLKGFTDQTGNAAYNLSLSRKRAENVKNYFISQMGIDPSQILINYFGQQKTSDKKDNPTDRRVEVEVFKAQ